MPRPSPGLGTRFPVDGGRTPDATCVMPPMVQQGASTTIPTTLVTVAPYHCDHTLALTVLLLQAKLQCSKPDFHDSNRARRRPTGMTTPSTMAPRTRKLISIGSSLSLHLLPEVIYRLTHVKVLPLLATIKGEAGYPSDITTLIALKTQV